MYFHATSRFFTQHIFRVSAFAIIGCANLLAQTPKDPGGCENLKWGMTISQIKRLYPQSTDYAAGELAISAFKYGQGELKAFAYVGPTGLNRVRLIEREAYKPGEAITLSNAFDALMTDPSKPAVSVYDTLRKRYDMATKSAYSGGTSRDIWEFPTTRIVWTRHPAQHQTVLKMPGDIDDLHSLLALSPYESEEETEAAYTDINFVRTTPATYKMRIEVPNTKFGAPTPLTSFNGVPATNDAVLILPAKIVQAVNSGRSLTIEEILYMFHSQPLPLQARLPLKKPDFIINFTTIPAAGLVQIINGAAPMYTGVIYKFGNNMTLVFFDGSDPKSGCGNRKSFATSVLGLGQQNAALHTAQQIAGYAAPGRCEAMLTR